MVAYGKIAQFYAYGIYRLDSKLTKKEMGFLRMKYVGGISTFEDEAVNEAIT